MTTRPGPTLPALRTGVAIIPMDGAVQLRLGDEEVHVLRTDAPELIRETLEQLDGTRDRQALLARLGPDAARLLDDLLDDLLAELARAGMLSAPGAQLDEVRAYLSPTASGTPDPMTALKRARVAVVGHARAAGLMAQVLAEHGIDATPVERARVVDGRAPGPDSAVVCVCEQPDLTLLFEVNDAVCNAGLPCLFVDLSHGRHASVGPFYVPGDGACYRCLRARLHENTAAYAELLAAERRMLESGNPLPAPGCLPAHRHVVTGVAAGEVVAFFARHRPLRTLNRAITVALEHARMWSEPVFRVPWCSGCATARGRESRGW